MQKGLQAKLDIVNPGSHNEKSYYKIGQANSFLKKNINLIYSIRLTIMMKLQLNSMSSMT